MGAVVASLFVGGVSLLLLAALVATIKADLAAATPRFCARCHAPLERRHYGVWCDDCHDQRGGAI